MSANDNPQTTKAPYYAGLPAGGGAYESALGQAGYQTGRAIGALGAAFIGSKTSRVGAAMAAASADYFHLTDMTGDAGAALGGGVGYVLDNGKTVIATIEQNLDTFFTQMNDPSWLPPDINGD